ncbi:MAG: NTP transferase domain-containing protein [Clostridia bacterium]|nr:NTP transferase domain-containing protein [Clostridia bacterium]
MQPSLVVLAAGMGSRFGGLKQITPVGPHGEIILDYSICDARLAGFRKIVFVIKEEIEDQFRELMEACRPDDMEYAYVCQRHDDLPGYVCPPDRRKPWGTGHAVYAARDAVDGAFGVIGADDFFGRRTFFKLYEFLSAPHLPEEMCMVGFRLANTLTENGSVSRGVCTVENGFLHSVTERTKIAREGGAVFCNEGGRRLPLEENAVVSMNVWGFHKQMFCEMERDLREFLSGMKDPSAEEYFLPSFVDRMIRAGKASVRVLRTPSKWRGVTYQEDREAMERSIRRLHARRVYGALR